MASVVSQIRKSLDLRMQASSIFHGKRSMAVGRSIVFLLALVVMGCGSSRTVNQTMSQPRPEPKIIVPNRQVSTPDNINYVYDYENIFTPAEEKSIDSLVRTFEKSNLIPIKISTVSNPSVTVDNFDQQNKTELTEWESVHGKSDHCMSILISKQLRRIRIDYGPFVSRLLSDDEVKAVIENQFTPSFKQDQFFQGTWNGVNTLMDAIRKNIK